MSDVVPGLRQQPVSPSACAPVAVAVASGYFWLALESGSLCTHHILNNRIVRVCCCPQRRKPEAVASSCCRCVDYVLGHEAALAQTAAQIMLVLWCLRRCCCCSCTWWGKELQCLCVALRFGYFCLEVDQGYGSSRRRHNSQCYNACMYVCVLTTRCD